MDLKSRGQHSSGARGRLWICAIAAWAGLASSAWGQTPPPRSVPALSTATAAAPSAPASLSGVVLTPTAYRGTGRFTTPGLNLDFVGAYYIGRLYGKNNLDWSTDKTNFIDRVGQWFFSVDGKMQIQSEGPWRPALAAGALGAYGFRDAPQPSLTAPGGTIQVSAQTTRSFGGAYLVASKRLSRNTYLSLGHLEGDAAGQVYLLSEFLLPQALANSGHPNQRAAADSETFGSLLWTKDPSSPFGVEIIKPDAAPLGPMLVNLKLGHLRFATFELAYLGFQGGWDLLGTIAFRWTQFPR